MDREACCSEMETASRICVAQASSLRSFAGALVPLLVPVAVVIFVVSGSRDCSMRGCSEDRPLGARTSSSARWRVVMLLTLPGTAGALAGRGGGRCDVPHFRGAASRHERLPRRFGGRSCRRVSRPVGVAARRPSAERLSSSFQGAATRHERLLRRFGGRSCRRVSRPVGVAGPKAPAQRLSSWFRGEPALMPNCLEDLS